MPFYKYLFYISVIYLVSMVRVLVYMFVNVNGMCYVHDYLNKCIELAQWGMVL